MSQAKSIYICENCGITVQPENYYGSGRFCCPKCARSFSSRYANTEEKRKQKSHTLKITFKNKEPQIKHCKKCGVEVISKRNDNNILCDNCRKLSHKKKNNISKNKSTVQKPKIDIELYEKIHSDILRLYDVYNFMDMCKILNVTSHFLSKIIKYYHIKSNPIFLSSYKYAVIRFSKAILHKETSITIEDYNKVKDILYHNIYVDNLLPSNIIELYNLDVKPDNFAHFITNAFGIKLRSLSDSLKLYHQNIGTYDNKTEKDIYYINCEFTFSNSIYPKLKGYELVKQYGWYDSIKNKNGVSRDHKISINYGFENNINPNLISHPANCEIMLMSDNSVKRTKCSITVNELKEQIKEWDTKYGVYNQIIYDENLLK